MAEVIYRFTTQTNTNWTNGDYAVDGSNNQYATRDIPGASADDEANNLTGTANQCVGTDLGDITKVELGVEGHVEGSQCSPRVRPVFGGSTEGSIYDITLPDIDDDINHYADITNDGQAPTWDWTEIQNLDSKWWGINTHPSQPRWLYLDNIVIRVTYTPGGTYAEGAITTDAPAVSGDVQVSRYADGAITADAATVSGTGIVKHYADGTITIDAAAVDGTSFAKKSASGAITSDSITISGTATIARYADGTITTDAATVAGTGVVEHYAEGAISADAATVAGTATIAGGEIYAEGAVTIDAAAVASKVVGLPGTEFICAVGPGQADYTSAAAWEAGTECSLYDTGGDTLVYSGSRTGTINDNASVTLYRGGVSQGVTATVVHATTTQILLEGITNTLTPQINDEWRVDGSNKFAITDNGNSAIAVAECANTGTTGDGEFTIGGATVSATNYRIVRAATGEEASQPFDTSHYWVEGDDALHVLSLSEDYVRVENIQISYDHATQGSRAGIKTNNANHIIDGCVLRQTTAVSGTAGLYVSAGSGHIVRNVIAYGWYYGLEAVCDDDGVDFLDNTSYGNAFRGLHVGAGDGNKCINNLCYNNTSADFNDNSSWTTFTYNFSKDNTAGTGTGCIRGDTDGKYPQFFNTGAGTEDLRIQSSSDAINAGLGPGADPDIAVLDFEGHPRAGATCDIGADEHYNLASGVITTDDIIVSGTATIAGAGTYAEGAITIAETTVSGTAKYLYATGAIALTEAEVEASGQVLVNQQSGAELVVKIVDTNGAASPDFTSLDAWEDSWGGIAGDGDCVAQNQIAVAKCRASSGVADTAAVWVDGWTSTSSLCYIQIYTDPAEGYRHRGVWPTSGNIYRLDSTQTVGIYVYEAWVRLDGIIVRHTASAATQKVVNFAFGGKNPRISDCVFVAVPGAYADHTCLYCWPGQGDVRAENCIAYNGKHGYVFGSGTAVAKNAFIYNNTCVDCEVNGFYRFNTNIDVNIYNNCAYNCTNDYNGTFAGSHNAYSEGGAPTGATASIDISAKAGTDLFKDYSGDDFHLKADPTNPLYQAGTDLRTDGYLQVVDDIDGHTRLTATFDVGADDLGAFSALTLEDATVDGTAELGVEYYAEGDITTDEVTISGVATVQHPATGAITLDDTAVSGEISIARSATGAVSVDPITTSSQASVAHYATGAITIDAAAVSGTAFISGVYSAAGDITTDSATVVGQATVKHPATGTITLEPTTVAGQAPISLYTPGTITTSEVEAAGTATVKHPTTGAVTIDETALSGQVLVGKFAQGDITIDPAEVSAVATVKHPASAALTIDPAEVSGVTSITRIAVGALTLSETVVDGTGTTSGAAEYQSEGTIVIEPASISGGTSIGRSALGAVTVEFTEIAGVATVKHNVSGAVTTEIISVSGDAGKIFQTEGSITVETIPVAGEAVVAHYATAAIQLEPVAVSGDCIRKANATANIVLSETQVSAQSPRSYSATGTITIEQIDIDGVCIHFGVWAIIGDVVTDPVTVAGVAEHLIAKIYLIAESIIERQAIAESKVTREEIAESIIED